MKVQKEPSESDLSLDGSDLLLATSRVDLIPWQVKYLKIKAFSLSEEEKSTGFLCWEKDPREAVKKGECIRFSLIQDGRPHTYKFHLYKNFKWLKTGSVSRLYLYFPKVSGEVEFINLSIY
jgi:hypothetical protein